MVYDSIGQEIKIDDIIAWIGKAIYSHGEYALIYGKVVNITPLGRVYAIRFNIGTFACVPPTKVKINSLEKSIVLGTDIKKALMLMKLSP